MDLKELIEKLEFGYDRAEGSEWVAFAINADNECAALIRNLRAAQKEIERLRGMRQEIAELKEQLQDERDNRGDVISKF